LHEDSSIKPSKPLIIAFSFEQHLIRILYFRFQFLHCLETILRSGKCFERVVFICRKFSKLWKDIKGVERSKGQLEAHLNLEAAGGGDFAWVQFDLKHSTRFEITLHLHLPQTVTSQTLSASIAFKSCLLLPLLLVHASQLKQRDLDRNCKEFLRLQKMFNFIAGLMTIP
ncbi:hypothetical protein T4E_4667, partial [Trichinella pseudospiralis]